MGKIGALAARPASTGAVQIRADIARLDAEVSLLRNRSQITPQTRARMDELGGQSSTLRAKLAAQSKSATHPVADYQSEQFARGKNLYLTHQAPALTAAQSALRTLTSCALPVALERDILHLNTALDRHHSTMNQFDRSRGVPQAMQRLLSRFAANI